MGEIMIRFNNDYSRGAHPSILAAFTDTNNENYGGYGIDPWCDKAAAEILKYLDTPADVHFLVGGTQTNVTVIASVLRPYQSVISAESGHINVHETGAVENSGHKIITLPTNDGKITASQIIETAKLYNDSDIREHIVQPKLVYISHPTEYGTVYSKSELESISAACHEYGLYLFVDGARLGYGIAASDITLADLARLCDVFYIGGTKCGAMFGEAVVITNNVLKPDFRSYIKQNGGMLAKGWLLGVQFYTLFKDGLYFDITKSAVEQAQRIKNAFMSIGVQPFVDSPTNQQFVVLKNSDMDKLSQKYVFEFDGKIDDIHSRVRFCTSWSTTDEEVDELVSDILKL